MLVRDVMQVAVVTATPATGLRHLLQLMRQRGIRHLPVVEQGALVGIVSDRDVKAATASLAMSGEGATFADRLDRLTAADIMSHPVHTLSPDFAVEAAARRMVDERVSALPVIEGGRLVGIVSETDVLRLFVRALGAAEPSSRLDVVLGSHRHALAEVLRLVEQAGAAVASVMTLAAPGGLREAVVRVATIDPAPAVRALTAAGYTVRDAARDSR